MELKITDAHEKWAQYMGIILWPWTPDGKASVYDWKTILAKLNAIHNATDPDLVSTEENEQEKIEEPSNEHKKWMT